LYSTIILSYIALIFSAGIILPFILFKVFSDGQISYKEWLGSYDITFLDLGFILACQLFMFVFTSFTIIVPSILAIYFVVIMQAKFQNDSIEIPKDKAYIYAFITSFLLFLPLQIIFNALSFEKYFQNINQYRVYQIIITLTIFVCYIFKLKLSDFNWKITIEDIIIVFITFCLLKLLYVFLGNPETLKKYDFYFLLRNFIQHIFYPSIVEEVIFRGFLLSALLTLNIRKDKANIFQAVIFGYSHASGYSDITIPVLFFSFFAQIFIGYLIGKIYLKNKSLTTCIILHALIDTI
jgi:membrane protease YdiL (CAAX protease family)